MKQIFLKPWKTVDLSSIRDLFGISSEWELCAWPISYNESVSFIFRNKNDGDVLDNGSDADYRFKSFTVSDFDFTHAIKRDVVLHGACLVSIFLWENGYAFIARNEDDNYEVAFYDENAKEISRISLGSNLCRAIVSKDGRIALGYLGTQWEENPCFKVLSRSGEVIYACNEVTALTCNDLTFDRHGNLWASCYPDSSTYEIKQNGTIVKHQYPVASPDCLIPFELNGKMAAILSFSGDQVYAPTNYLYVDEKSYAIHFGRLHEKDIDGISAFAGLVIVRSKNDTLAFFKLDEISKLLEK